MTLAPRTPPTPTVDPAPAETFPLTATITAVPHHSIAPRCANFTTPDPNPTAASASVAEPNDDELPSTQQSHSEVQNEHDKQSLTIIPPLSTQRAADDRDMRRHLRAATAVVAAENHAASAPLQNLNSPRQRPKAHSDTTTSAITPQTSAHSSSLSNQQQQLALESPPKTNSNNKSPTQPSQSHHKTSLQPSPTVRRNTFTPSKHHQNNNSNKSNPSKSAHAPSPQPPLLNRPLPRNLPKTVKHRPDNARVFIGNLASEYTDVHEIITVFHKYGDLIEEPVLRRSFGFVQYSSAHAARRAVAGEQGRIIGGIAIDLSIADNREVKRGTHVVNNTPYGQHPSHQNKQQQQQQPQPQQQHVRGRVRERDFGHHDDKARKRRRSLSPASAAKKGGVHPPQYRRMRPDPKNGIYLRILCMSPTARSYAKHCEATFRSMTGLAADVLHIVAAGLGEALGRATRDVIPYVMVVASKDVEGGTCTIRTLEKTGYEKSGRGNGVIPLREAVEVCLIERGVIAPQNIAQQIQGPGAPNHGMKRMGHNAAANQGGRHSGMSGHGRPWNGQHNNGHMNNPPVQAAKPGWMTGPRAPHPSNARGGAPTSMATGVHKPPPGNMGSGIMPAGGYAFTGVDGNRGHYGPGPVAPPSAPHRSNQTYSRGPPAPTAPAPPGAYEPGPQIVQGPPGIGAPGQQLMGGDYVRRPGNASINPAMGIHPPGGYVDRYSIQGNNQNTIGYVGRGETRESEYDPTVVMPANRGSNMNYGSNWNREVTPLNRDGYGGGERPPPPHQPAVARDPNGGFQTIGGGTQVYPGGSGGAATSNYGFDRSQNPNATVGGYGGVHDVSGYDGRQNTYASGPPGAVPVGYGQFIPPQGSIGPQGADGANRYGGAAAAGGAGAGGGMYGGAQQGYGGNTIPDMYNGSAVGNNVRGGAVVGWNSAGSTHQAMNVMNMHGANMSGPNANAGSGVGPGRYGHGSAGGQMGGIQGGGPDVHNGPPQSMSGGYGGVPIPNNHTNRSNTSNGYIGRGSGGGSNGNAMNATTAANMLGAGAVDIKKLTSLISEFQQKQAASQAPGRGHLLRGPGPALGGENGERRGGGGGGRHGGLYHPQYQGQQGHHQRGVGPHGQHGYYR